MVQADDFDASVPLPPGLSIPMIRKAADYIEEELVHFVDLYLEQANVVSTLVGIFGTRALDSFSNFEKHRHAYTAQQRFPDLCRRSAKKPLSPNDCLESKGSKRPFLKRTDWKYEKSKAGDSGGGRTHTFGVPQPSRKLSGKAVYERSDITLVAGKPVPINGN